MRGYAQALHDAEKGLDLINSGEIEISPGATTTENDDKVP
jgi:hypothetical protein